jgi:glutaredoxin
VIRIVQRDPREARRGVVRGARTLLCATLCLLALVVLGVFGSACKRSPAAALDVVEAAAPLTVRPETEGLLLTWIDDKGDFHVETKVADVPLMGRDTVRVVDTSKDPPTTDSGQITVVDLRQAKADGTYPLRALARADFDALALARREQKGPTLANVAPPPSAESAAPSPSTTVAAKPSKRGVVIIYGAEWCGACHEAARYLRHKGIPYVEKDIEKDEGAAREMQDKLAKNGLGGGSIPVIDVHGKVMIGFDAAAIDSALGAAL